MQQLGALVRAEWLVVFLLSIWGFSFTGQSWWLLVALLLAPDLSMLGYLAGPRVGAAVYNAFHVLFWPAGLIAYGLWASDNLVLALGLIWLAHIAMDRMLGYGLKLTTDFRDTHLGRIGRDR